MTTFLLILGGLIAFNFFLLHFSIQSVDADKKKGKVKKVKSSIKEKEIKTTEVAKAA